MIFVDFDDTLCLHSKKIKTANWIFTDNIFSNSVPNYPLIKKLYKLREQDSDIILITMASSFMLERKKKWCQKNCPELFSDFIGLSIDCSKKEYINAYKNKLKNNQCIFIDDNNDERSQVEELKFVKVFSPQLFCLDLYK